MTVPYADVRAASAVETYRLERALYDHALAVARRVAASRGAPVGTDVMIAGLRPPPRPIVALDVADAPRLGATHARVELIVVEDLAEPETRRLDALVRRMAGRYGSAVAIVHHDLLDPGHAGGLGAAVAGRCAHAQGRFWEYRARLLASLDAERPPSLVEEARMAGLDRRRFVLCVDDPATARAVRTASAHARARGIAVTPVVLVNGIYVEGAEAPAVLEPVVGRALAAAAGDAAVPDSPLPFDVTGIVQIPGASPQAVVVPRDASRSLVVRAGDTLPGGATVLAIGTDALLLSRDGATERLRLGVRPLDAPPIEARDTGDEREESAEEAIGAVAPDDQLHVSVGAALLDEVRRTASDLAAQFTPTVPGADGRPLLQLTGAEHAELLASLGLEPGDVVVRANDRWVHAGGPSPLAELVRDGGAMLLIVRDGTPRIVHLGPRGE